MENIEWNLIKSIISLDWINWLVFCPPFCWRQNLTHLLDVYFVHSIALLSVFETMVNFFEVIILILFITMNALKIFRFLLTPINHFSIAIWSFPPRIETEIKLNSFCLIFQTRIETVTPFSVWKIWKLKKSATLSVNYKQVSLQ